jgi:hypothetical protein
MINHDNLAIIDFFNNTHAFLSITLVLISYNLKRKNLNVIKVTNFSENLKNSIIYSKQRFPQIHFRKKREKVYKIYKFLLLKSVKKIYAPLSGVLAPICVCYKVVFCFFAPKKQIYAHFHSAVAMRSLN